MQCKELQVTNKVGLHARPASLLIQTAKKFKSTITITKEDQQVNLGSIVSLLKLRVKNGDVILLRTDGPDESQAIDELTSLIESKFGES